MLEAEDSEGYNALTGEFTDMFKSRRDHPDQGRTHRPAERQSEVAILLLTTDCIVVEAPKKSGGGGDHDHGEGMDDMM